MSKQNPTFEEVNAHIEKADLKKLKAVSASAAAGPGQICAAYKTIRPILLLIINFPFIPSKWKAAIKAFMAAMDTFCPGS